MIVVMGEKKNNIRSFRYSDRVAEILEGMEGKTLNEKFENLVITCHAALPEIQRKIEIENKSLKRMRDEWWELVQLTRKVQERLSCIDRMSADLDELVSRSEGMIGKKVTQISGRELPDLPGHKVY